MKITNFAVPAGLALAFALVAPAAQADSTIRTPGDHPHYAIEVEPHGLLGFFGPWGSGLGFGAGLRLSIPVMQNGFIPKINNSVAITFGGDFMHYDSGCYYLNYGCNGSNALYFPVALQWNFFVAQKWSVMGEVGAAPYYDFYTDYCGTLPLSQQPYCSTPSHFSVAPVFNAGARYHFSEHVALTMRVGYPSISVGVSFM